MSAMAGAAGAAARVRTPGKAGEGGGIQSLERAAALLEAVAASPDGIGLADLAGRVELHTSTAFHLTKTLLGLGFLSQDVQTKRYRIGSRVFMLAAGALTENALLVLGTPILERLSAATGEAAHLAVRSRHEIALVARTAATGMLQMSERSGVSRPAHATAIGKMLVAQMQPDERDRLLAAVPLTAFTPNTITDPDAFRRELDAVRLSGVAHDRAELDIDVRCIAVPVRDFAGRCVAAMGISGPVWRMGEAELAAKLAHLSAAAAELSAALGHHSASAAG